MARPSLFTHRKFSRLSRVLGARYKAVGALEMVWRVAHECGDADLGEAEDVEYAADWDGEPGILVAALVSSGFLELIDGRYFVHDMDDHAPSYVQDRRRKEAQRRRRKTGQSRDGHGTVTGQAKDGHASPAPAPAPAPLGDTDVSPISSSSRRQTKAEKEAERRRKLEGFDEWWTIYPKKTGKKPAQGKWVEKQIVRPDLPVLLDATRVYARSVAREGRDKRYIKNPETWLNQELWTDHVPDPGANGKKDAVWLSGELKNLERKRARMREILEGDDLAHALEVLADEERDAREEVKRVAG